METLPNDFLKFMELNPHYGYLIGAAGFALVLVGTILNWNWVMQPGGGWPNLADWENTFGNKTVLWFRGGVFAIAMLLMTYQFISIEFYN